MREKALESLLNSIALPLSTLSLSINLFFFLNKGSATNVPPWRLAVYEPFPSRRASLPASSSSLRCPSAPYSRRTSASEYYEVFNKKKKRIWKKIVSLLIYFEFIKVSKSRAFAWHMHANDVKRLTLTYSIHFNTKTVHWRRMYAIKRKRLEYQKKKIV